MTYFMALLIALSALFNTPTQAPLSPLSQAPITASSQALTYEAPKVGTVPAPQAPEAPSQALYEAPSQAPICEEDMPCWDCHTMGNLICGNEAPQAPVQATQHAQQAPVKGFTPAAPVVIPDYAEPATVQPPVETGTDAPFIFEGAQCPVIHPLEGGMGAWAGAGTACQIHKGK